MNHTQVRRLQNHHRWLEQRLFEAQRRPSPDLLEVQELKRQKLRVKDELFLAEARLQAVRSYAQGPREMAFG